MMSIISDWEEGEFIEYISLKQNSAQLNLEYFGKWGVENEN